MSSEISTIGFWTNAKAILPLGVFEPYLSGGVGLLYANELAIAEVWEEPEGASEPVQVKKSASDGPVVDPDQIHKTLIAGLDDGRVVVAVVPVARQLDLEALAACTGAKRASLADARAAERSTGDVLGGISPLGQKRRLPTVIDESAVALERICLGAGRWGLEIGLDPADRIALTSASVARIARGERFAVPSPGDDLINRKNGGSIPRPEPPLGSSGSASSPVPDETSR